MSAPRSSAPSAARPATPSDSRAPRTRRAKTSRPSASVPSGNQGVPAVVTSFPERSHRSGSGVIRPPSTRARADPRGASDTRTAPATRRSHRPAAATSAARARSWRTAAGIVCGDERSRGRHEDHSSQQRKSCSPGHRQDGPRVAGLPRQAPGPRRTRRARETPTLRPRTPPRDTDRARPAPRTSARRGQARTSPLRPRTIRSARSRPRCRKSTGPIRARGAGRVARGDGGPDAAGPRAEERRLRERLSNRAGLQPFERGGQRQRQRQRGQDQITAVVQQRPDA